MAEEVKYELSEEAKEHNAQVRTVDYFVRNLLLSSEGFITPYYHDISHFTRILVIYDQDDDHFLAKKMYNLIGELLPFYTVGIPLSHLKTRKDFCDEITKDYFPYGVLQTPNQRYLWIDLDSLDEGVIDFKKMSFKGLLDRYSSWFTKRFVF